MTSPTDVTSDPVPLLERALTQTEGLIAEAVQSGSLDSPSTCEGWTVGDLVRHVVAAPANFVTMFGGGDADWANPPDLGPDPVSDFRTPADELLEQARSASRSSGSNGASGSNGLSEGGTSPAEVAIPEFAVHGWDIARSIGSETRLDDAVAERALAFMQANLTPENREGVFAPEVDAPGTASVQDRLAAFAGRQR